MYVSKWWMGGFILFFLGGHVENFYETRLQLHVININKASFLITLHLQKN